MKQNGQRFLHSWNVDPSYAGGWCWEIALGGEKTVDKDFSLRQLSLGSKKHVILFVLYVTIAMSILLTQYLLNLYLW